VAIKSRRSLVLVILGIGAIAIVLSTAVPALARMGGGHSYGGGRGGGGGGYGGGGGGGGDLIFFLIRLCFHWPQVGIPLLLIVVAFWFFSSNTKSRRYSNSIERSLPPRPAFEIQALRVSLAQLREKDPIFSRVLFLDFARVLYTRYHEGRGTAGDEPSGVRPFLSGDLWEQLERQRSLRGEGAIREVKDVVIGSASIERIEVSGEWANVSVRFVANYTHVFDGGTPEAPFYVEERAFFRRKAAARSKGPDEMRSLHCPGCGSPVAVDSKGLCAHCGRANKPGEDQWELRSLDRLIMNNRDAFEKTPPDQRTNSPALPLVMDPGLDAGRRDLIARDPSFSPQAFETHVKTVFADLQKAWSSLDWEPTRSMQTESLYNTNLFWIERFRRQRRRNVLDDAEVQQIFPVKFERDAFYDIITVRIRAQGHDYTVDAQGDVIGGSRTRVVDFREYWTFVRRQIDAEGPKEEHCPNCGAPVPGAQSQECPFCGGLLHSAEFDWTLAFIDQEQAYMG